MRTLLRIDASVRREGSYSRALGDYFEACWKVRNPDGGVVTRDLAAEPPPHLAAATVAAFQGAPTEEGPGVALSDAFIGELEAADDVLVTSALYNFNVASPLKAWLDHVVRHGRTFLADANGFRGLLGGRSVCLVTARGGLPESGPDFQGPSVRAVFAFLGFDRIGWVSLEGTKVPDNGLETRLAAARTEIDAWFAPDSTAAAAGDAVWRGDFSARDRAEIDALRDGQVRAILAGDAEAYAALCADDVLLMLQGHDIAAGLDGFLSCERELLAGTRFAAMRQIPLRIERQGDLAIECGRQEVELAPDAARAEAFRPLRKYTHVLRRTGAGWKFAVLMSNSNV